MYILVELAVCGRLHHHRPNFFFILKLPDCACDVAAFGTGTENEF